MGCARWIGWRLLADCLFNAMNLVLKKIGTRGLDETSLDSTSESESDEESWQRGTIE